LRQRKYGVPGNVSSDAHEQLVLALERLGFRRAQALRAVRAAAERQRGDEQTREQLLREALLEATKAA
jgi:Holliday junction resolvasome RuvABC DNA-binding subunit